MPRRLLRITVLTLLVLIAGLVVIPMASHPASAATATQNIDCGVGGAQTLTIAQETRGPVEPPQ